MKNTKASNPMKIKQLLSNRSKWTQRTCARNKKNKTTLSTADDAVKWCLYGAALKVYPETPERQKIVKRIEKALPKNFRSIGDWNDDGRRKFSDVKKLVTKLDI